MKYTTEQRVFLVDSFAKLQNCTLVQRAYRKKFRSKMAPSHYMIKCIYKKFTETGSTHHDYPKKRKNAVRTDDLVKSVKDLFISKPNCSLRKAASVINASVKTIRTTLRKNLGFKPYKKKKTFRLYKADYTKRLHFSKFIIDRPGIHNWLICSDEAYFYLSGGHNIQNDRIWAQFQPDYVLEKSLKDEKVMVWCAFSSKHVYGPYFFEKNVNGSNYLEMLKSYFWQRHLRVKGYKKYFFQQDGAPAHRKKEVQTWLTQKFGERFINKDRWPPRSPDLNPLDFSLWGILKHSVYDPIPSTRDELKANIEREIKKFRKSDFESIFSNFLKRCSLLQQTKGRHIEHLLK